MWKPSMFFVLVGSAGRPVSRSVQGVIARPFGIYDRDAAGERGRARWSVTHLPTGQCIADSDNGFACIALVGRLHADLPGAFDGVTTAQGAGDLRMKTKQICDDIGELRFGGSGLP